MRYTSTGKEPVTGMAYRSASTLSSDGVISSNGPGRQHQRQSRSALVRQSRAFARDNGLYAGMLDRAVRYVVGNGFSLQAKSGSTAWNKRAEALWQAWWTRPDITGLMSGPQVERMVCRELFTCGDVGVLKILGAPKQIQLIESEQIASSKVFDDGIVTDEYGRVIGFSVAPWGNAGMVELSRATVRAPDVFIFVADPQRPSEFRGVPPCQSVFAMLHRINDVCDSEAIAWQMLSRLAVSVTRERGPESAYDESIDDTSLNDDGDIASRVTELDYALIFNGQPGDEIKGIDRNIPGSNFSESLTMFLRLLGSPLGLPLELILLDWTRSNYSQSRAVLEQAYQTFRCWQSMLISQMYSPLYEWVIGEAMATGELGNRKDGLAHTWITPTFPWVDQLKEAQAYAQKVSLGFMSHAQVCKTQSLERSDVVDAREAEVMDAIGRAKKIQDRTGVEVPWQMFAGLDSGFVQSVTRLTPTDDDAADDGGDVTDEQESEAVAEEDADE